MQTKLWNVSTVQKIAEYVHVEELAAGLGHENAWAHEGGWLMNWSAIQDQYNAIREGLRAKAH